MEVQKARDLYLGKAGVRVNCAQAVAIAFGEDPAIFAACGRGQAPEGWCGAAHVAAHLTGNRAAIEDTFLETAGTIRCSELRSGRKLSCVACIEKSVQLVQQARS